MKERNSLEIDPETDIHLTVSSIDDVEDYGNAIYQGLKEVRMRARDAENTKLIGCLIVIRTIRPGPSTRWAPITGERKAGVSKRLSAHAVHSTSARNTGSTYP